MMKEASDSEWERWTKRRAKESPAPGSNPDGAGREIAFDSPKSKKRQITIIILRNYLFLFKFWPKNASLATLKSLLKLDRSVPLPLCVHGLRAHASGVTLFACVPFEGLEGPRVTDRLRCFRQRLSMMLVYLNLSQSFRDHFLIHATRNSFERALGRITARALGNLQCFAVNFE